MRSKLLTAFVLALVALAVLPGCGPFWVNPYITVTDSPLNWMEIHYYTTSRKPARRISLYMNGTGHVEVKRGTSALISDDFAKGFNDATWSDIRVQRMEIDPGHVHETFQNLVNHGVLDREKWGRSGKKKEHTRFIAVKANINNVTYSENVNIFESDPDLAEHLVDTIWEFTTPSQR